MLLILVCLQAIQVAILWTHDWVPLGPLNDVAAAQARDTRSRLVRVTLIQSLPFTIGLVATVVHARIGRPPWLWNWVWSSYAILFAGELRAWWWPCLVRAERERAARYRGMFGATSAFLHAVAEEGIALRDVAETIGARWRLPVVALPPQEVDGSSAGWPRLPSRTCRHQAPGRASASTGGRRDPAYSPTCATCSRLNEGSRDRTANRIGPTSPLPSGVRASGCRQ